MNPNSPTRVAVVDSHEVAVLGLRTLIGDIPGLAFAGSAATVTEYLSEDRTADVVILDLDTPDGSHPTTNISQLTAAGIQVLVFTGYHPYLLRIAAETDVLGVVRKTEPLSLVEAILAGDSVSPVQFSPQVHLSAREEAVLRLFADGLKAQAVSSELNLAPSTVDDYLRRIRHKFAAVGRAAVSKTDLHKRAMEEGLLPYPGTPHAR